MAITSVSKDGGYLVIVEDGITKRRSIVYEDAVCSLPPNGYTEVGVIYVDETNNKLVVQYNGSTTEIELDATADLTGAEIVALLEALGSGSRLEVTYLDDGSTYIRFTVAERTKLGNIETGATADQTGAEIVALLEALTAGNRLSHTKLDDVGASDHHTKTTSISDLTDHDKTAHDALNIDADTVDGDHKADLESTMDSKIATHKGDANAHHTKYTDAEAKAAAVQAGAITNGVTKAPTHDAVYDVKVTADTATTPAEVDSKINTHKGDASAHHAKTTSGEIDHGSVQGLADDDHTQYLNTARHDTTTRHSLGTVVPHDSHGNLSGVTSDQHHARSHDHSLTADNDLLNPTAMYRVDNGCLRVLNPKGGAATWGSAQTGAIQIKLPTYSRDMLFITGDVYPYLEDKGFKFIAGGYAYSPGTWIKTFARIIGKDPHAIKVRFARNADSTEQYILLGETTTSWPGYTQVAITSVSVGYGQAIADYKEGWEISIVDDLTGYAIARTIDDATIAPEIDAKITTHETGGKHRWTADKLLKGAGVGSDPVEIDVPSGATKEFFVPVTYRSGGTLLTHGWYVVGSCSALNHDTRVVFRIPHDFSSIISAEFIIIPTATEAAANYDLYSHYASVGQGYNTHEESDLASTYNVTSDQLFAVDISGVLSSIVAGDIVGITIKEATIYHNFEGLGVRFKYS